MNEVIGMVVANVVITVGTLALIAIGALAITAKK